MNKKTKKTIIIVACVVVGLFVLYNVVRFFVVASMVNDVQNDTRERVCCIDAGGMWSKNGCINIEDNKSYSECLGK